ncbi:MAG: spore germination protein [Clostridia bacterium]|nr:spore germination protein [Clostridia bacterium]
MKIKSSLKENISTLKNTLKSQDIIYYEFENNNNKYCVAYVDSITDKAQIGELVVRPIFENNPENLTEVFYKLQIPHIKQITQLSEALKKLLSGHTLLLCDGDNFVISCDFLFYQSRAVAEPPTATVVRGPREGFTESIKTNLSLIRRRIKVSDFIIENKEVGKYSQTVVSICYISSIVDEKIVEQVKQRIEQIEIDGVPDSSYIAKCINEHKTSLFKQVGNTEKPDIFVQKMLEGRVGILVDGSPIGITVPYMIIEDLQTSEDYFINNYRANMERGIRIISLVMAILLPALFVSAQLFHLQIIPLNFLLTIVNSIKGIPLSPSFEMFFTLLIFELLNEASIRMPKYVGMALSIVGALVLGDTAVKAGIVSTPTIMIMALSGICLYTAPELVDSMSVLRLVYLIAAGSLGGYGIALLSTYILTYLCSVENFGVPLLTPFAPLSLRDMKDSVYIDFLTNMKDRPQSLNSKNKRRMKIKERLK